MKERNIQGVLRHLKGLIGRREAADQSDEQLLDQFARRRDEGPFAVLVQRHGGMVLAVCRRVLRDPQDADDAFQATFLVLARKAGSIRRQGSLGSWLYRVAYHVAVKVRARVAKRLAHEQRAADMPPSCSPHDRNGWAPDSGFAGPAAQAQDRQADPAAAAALDELRAVMDEELSRLPEKYRAPLVLCYLEGKTNAEAAAQLDWPEGSVKGQMARAREVLRTRLARRGLALSTGALAGLLEQTGIAAPVPAQLAETTVKLAPLFAAGEVAAGVTSERAAALAGEMLLSMTASKVKVSAAVLVLLVSSLGAAGVVGRVSGHLGDARNAAAQVNSRKAEPAPVDAVQLRFALGGHTRAVQAIRFSPDGLTAATGSKDGHAKLWSMTTGREVGDFSGLESVAHCRFSPDGKSLAAFAEGNGAGRIWDLKNRDTISRLDDARRLSVLDFSRDGKRVATANILEEIATVRVTDTRTGLRREMVTLENCPASHRIGVLSPDGNVLVTTGRDGALMFWNVFLWEGAPARVRSGARAAGYGRANEYLAFSPDGQSLTTVSAGGTVRLWDVSTGRERASVRLQGIAVEDCCVALSADGTRLAVGVPSGELSVWNLRPAELAFSDVRAKIHWTGHSAAILAMSFSADGQFLATASADETAKVWQLSTSANATAR